MQHRISPRIVRRALGLGVGLIGLTLAALLLTVIAQGGRILPGTQVLGVDLGGRDEWAARRMLEPVLRSEVERQVAVTVPGERLHVRPSDLGVHYDLEATVQAAMARGRRGPFAPLSRLTAGIGTRNIPVVVSVDEMAVAAWVEMTAERIDRSASVGDVTVERAGLTVTTVVPHGSLTVDTAASRGILLAALTDPEVRRVTLAVDVTLPPSPYAAIERISNRLASALAAPIVLLDDERRLEVSPRLLADIVEIATVNAADGAAPALVIPVGRVFTDIAPQARDLFESDAVDARILTPDDVPVRHTDLSSTEFSPSAVSIEVLPGRNRTIVVPQRLADQIVEMIMAGTRVAEADLFRQEPRFTTAAALEGTPTHLLGTFTTFYPAGAARTINIHLLADIIDDVLVAPGAEFSINRTSGPRRCGEGFVPAGTIIRGELVDTCGGGVSQLGTTVMNAAFFAGVELRAWQPHSFFISRYPAGREATLSYPDLDVSFVNDTSGWLVLRTSHTPDSVTVALYGIPEWQSVRADHGERRAPTAFSEVRRSTFDLPPGRTRVVQSGGDGFTISVARTSVPASPDGGPRIERWTTVYRPQQRIVEVGEAPAPLTPDAAPDAGPLPEAAGAGIDG